MVQAWQHISNVVPLAQGLRISTTPGLPARRTGWAFLVLCDHSRSKPGCVLAGFAADCPVGNRCTSQICPNHQVTNSALAKLCKRSWMTMNSYEWLEPDTGWIWLDFAYDSQSWYDRFCLKPQASHSARERATARGCWMTCSSTSWSSSIVSRTTTRPAFSLPDWECLPRM